MQTLLSTVYNVGARVWVPSVENVWEGATVTVAYDGETLQVTTESGRCLEISTTNSDELPPLRNPDILIGENDLTSLSYLHEPAVLYNLLVRFSHKYNIYTYCGIVLVAINPYQELSIYNTDTIWAYRGRSMGELEPHIFAIAEESYTRLDREKRDQSIIVSGESGAGKTVSAKYIMRYFATVSGSSNETQIEKKVLASSPIMEAIGNAKTTRNDNSSRFGKFTELQFNKYYQIIGASMRTYLLEKSRVVSQANGERNYHIFYQLCSAREKFPELKISTAEEYYFLSLDTQIEGVDDEKNFDETCAALSTLGFHTSDQNNIFRILAGILHLGNVNICDTLHGDAEASCIDSDDFHLSTLCDILRINRSDLCKWLCHRKITSMKEVFDKPMNVAEANQARDALAKFIYEKLFAWIVSVINRSLESSHEKHRFIGVLDIYGFETFEFNSFEQFCINYANEKLQQQFNLHVFKLDQEEYTKEGIAWDFIDFYDNQPCIDLIETRLGILDLLDEECKMPKGTYESWGEKLYSKCCKWEQFSKPRFGTNSFIIKHFADSVEYQMEGFLEKNRDTVIEDQIVVLRQSGNHLLKKLFAQDDEKKASLNHAATIGHSGRVRLPVNKQVSLSATLATTSTKGHKKTVGTQFRDSLNALMTTLNATTPHYIRCVKPNDEKLPFDYNPQRAVQQLRACGVLETIRISAAGFPSRILYDDFFNRYKILCRSDRWSDKQQTYESVLKSNIQDEDKYKYGKTKLFFRAGQIAYLERLRAERLKKCCIVIQKTVRGFLQKRKYQKLKIANLIVQRYARGFMARRRVNKMRREKAAITIQKYVRGWLECKKYRQIQKSVTKIQTCGRGLLARRKYELMRRNHAAIIIQKNVRGWLCRLHRKKYVASVIMCQCAVRKHFAVKRLRQLKQEARSIEHVKGLNKGLENKIISLTHKIEIMKKEIVDLKSASQELADLKIQMEIGKNIEKELAASRKIICEKDEILENERKYREEIVNANEKKITFLEQKCLQMESDREILIEEINQLKEANNNKGDIFEVRGGELLRENQIMLHELDENRDAYQKLLAERNSLESRVNSLEKQLAKFDPTAYGHQRSNSDTSTASAQASRCSPTSTADIISTKDENVDIGLVLKLQQKLKDVQIERDELFDKIDTSERIVMKSQTQEMSKDAFRVQDLEIENENLRKDLDKLRKSVANETSPQVADELMRQFHDLQEELSRRREECAQLHNILSTNSEGLKNVAKANYTPDADLNSINEDGELVLAFEAQKQVNRQLEDELQKEKSTAKYEIEKLKEEISKLRIENESHQRLLSDNLSKTPQTQSEAFMHFQITRLTSENLELRDKHDALVKENRIIRKHLEKDDEKSLDRARNNLNTSYSASSFSFNGTSEINQHPSIARKKQESQGMIEFHSDDILTIARTLVYDLKPSLAVTLSPGLPAYVIFLCVRHTDYMDDVEKVGKFLMACLSSIRKVTKKHSRDLDTMLLWLSNSTRLLNLLKQYSGEQVFKEYNTPTQNTHCLQHFDLTEYRQVFHDMAISIYQSIMATIQLNIHELCIAAILEYEGIPNLSGGKQLTKSQSASVTGKPESPTIDNLQKQLTFLYDLLISHEIGVSIVLQIFKQIYYFICATTLNNLLLRKELCHWSKGMQIRYNLSNLEQWARDQNFRDYDVSDMLQPIVQASQLLQARKTDADVDTLCDMCNRMTSCQIIKLLNMYTPTDGYEEKVSMSFIKSVQRKLEDRVESHEQTNLLMDTKFIFPLRLAYHHSNVRLEDIEIPDVLGLNSFLKKL